MRQLWAAAILAWACAHNAILTRRILPLCMQARTFATPSKPNRTASCASARRATCATATRPLLMTRRRRCASRGAPCTSGHRTASIANAARAPFARKASRAILPTLPIARLKSARCGSRAQTTAPPPHPSGLLPTLVHDAPRRASATRCLRRATARSASAVAAPTVAARLSTLLRRPRRRTRQTHRRAERSDRRHRQRPRSRTWIGPYEPSHEPSQEPR